MIRKIIKTIPFVLLIISLVISIYNYTLEEYNHELINIVFTLNAVAYVMYLLIYYYEDKE